MESYPFHITKNGKTVKVLIGITLSGVISFVSQSYKDSASDRNLVEQSRLLEMLEPGDEVMAIYHILQIIIMPCSIWDSINE